MESEQIIEWTLVRDRAVAHLRECGHIRISKHCPQAQFLILPSFTDTVSVDIVLSNDELAAYVTRWQQTTDIEAFATPVERLKHSTPFMPTYDTTRLNITHDRLNSILSRLAATPIKLSPTANSMSVDGTSYELNSGMGFTGIRLRWHNQLPDEWTILSSVVDELQEMATSALGHAT
jgi:hypothetical protein